MSFGNNTPTFQNSAAVSYRQNTRLWVSGLCGWVLNITEPTCPCSKSCTLNGVFRDARTGSSSRWEFTSSVDHLLPVLSFTYEAVSQSGDILRMHRCILNISRNSPNSEMFQGCVDASSTSQITHNPLRSKLRGAFKNCGWTVIHVALHQWSYLNVFRSILCSIAFI